MYCRTFVKIILLLVAGQGVCVCMSVFACVYVCIHVCLCMCVYVWVCGGGGIYLVHKNHFRSLINKFNLKF